MSLPSLSELNAMDQKALRALVRERYPNFRGVVGINIRKDECISVLTEPGNAGAIYSKIMARISTPAVNPYAMSVPSMSATVSAASKATHPAAPVNMPAIDFNSPTDAIGQLLKQQIQAGAQQLADQMVEEAKVELAKAADDKYVDVIKDLEQQISDLASRAASASVGPTLVAEGAEIMLDGVKCKSIGGDPAYLPHHDANFKVDAWRAETIAKRTKTRFIQKFDFLLKSLLNGYTIWLAGPPGCGKTTVFEYIASVLNWPLIKVAGNKDLAYDDFVGSWTVQNASTVWIDGPAVTAMKIGAILLVDEVGLCPSETTNVLHSIAENNAKGTLTITLKGGEIVRPHPNFRIVATDNSMGFAENVALYPDQRVQSAAFMDRFSVKLNVGYPTDAQERNILVAKTGVKKDLADLMVKIANETRRAVRDEKMMLQLSTRKLLAWADVTVKFGDVGLAFASVVLPSVPPDTDDEAVLIEIAQRHLGAKLGGEIVADAEATTENGF